MIDNAIDRLLEEMTRLAIEQTDVLLVSAVFVLSQVAKMVWPRLPKVYWFCLNIGLGLLMALLSTPFENKRYFCRQWVIYAAWAEIMYQFWKAAKAVRSKFKK
jgi:hypothetical protein